MELDGLTRGDVAFDILTFDIFPRKTGNKAERQKTTCKIYLFLVFVVVVVVVVVSGNR